MDRYLHPGDYSIQIRTEIKTLLGGVNEKKLIVAEHAAAGQMKSYLKKLYDIDQIFFLLKGQHNQALAYALGDRVYYKESGEEDADYKVYTANAALPASTAWNITNWTLLTSRNPFILLYLVDITLYHLHSKDATRLVPQLRQDRYDDALDWLKLVGKGEIDADLPQITETDPEYKPDIRYNSHPAENQRW